MVAVPPSQPSPAFGQAASSQTVFSFEESMESLNSAYREPGPPGALALNQLGRVSGIGASTDGVRNSSVGLRSSVEAKFEAKGGSATCKGGGCSDAEYISSVARTDGVLKTSFGLRSSVFGFNWAGRTPSSTASARSSRTRNSHVRRLWCGMLSGAGVARGVAAECSDIPPQLPRERSHGEARRRCR